MARPAYRLSYAGTISKSRPRSVAGTKPEHFPTTQEDGQTGNVNVTSSRASAQMFDFPRPAMSGRAGGVTRQNLAK